MKFADKRLILTCAVTYNERNNLQVELIRFLKQIYTLYTFTFAKRGIICNVAHQTQLVLVWKQVYITVLSYAFLPYSNVFSFQVILDINTLFQFRPTVRCVSLIYIIYDMRIISLSDCFQPSSCHNINDYLMNEAVISKHSIFIQLIMIRIFVQL